MKILIKSEDAKKLAKLLEQMDVTDTGVELGDDLFVDGKIIVNSADDVVDINGQPIAGGGGSELYIHEGYVQDDEYNAYSFKILSPVSTAYTNFEDMNDDNYKLFQLRDSQAETVAYCSIESEKSGDYYSVITVDGEPHDFETVTYFIDRIL